MSRFYDKAIWRRVRKQIVRRDNYRCVACHAFVGALGAARVDHIEPLEQAPHRALDPANLRTLCAACDNRAREKVTIHKITRADPVVHGCDERGYPIAPSHGWTRGMPDIARGSQL